MDLASIGDDGTILHAAVGADLTDPSRAPDGSVKAHIERLALVSTSRSWLSAIFLPRFRSLKQPRTKSDLRRTHIGDPNRIPLGFESRACNMIHIPRIRLVGVICCVALLHLF